MAKHAFQEFKFRESTYQIIDYANTIIAAYEQQGYQLTLRQLYYQFVARDLLENTERNYKRLGEIISNARLAGFIDWNAIEDRTRSLRSLAHWTRPSEIINAAYYSFRIDKWANQPNYVEVWVEKDALVGVLERVCNRYEVNFFACRGYVSQSEMYSAAQRFQQHWNECKEVTILHLGDHDPSGIDMTRDIQARMSMFLEEEWTDIRCNVQRLALNWEQIEVYNPPPNPAKTTDARFQAYQQDYGNESWELDALEPSVIDQLIEDHILELRDENLWDEKVAEEADHRKMLERVSQQWNDVAQFLEDKEN